MTSGGWRGVAVSQGLGSSVKGPGSPLVLPEGAGSADPLV